MKRQSVNRRERINLNQQEKQSHLFKINNRHSFNNVQPNQRQLSPRPDYPKVKGEVMPSQLKSDTARANGAKSKGPKTAETREISSRNSLKHGYTARHNMLLACEDPDLFQRMVDEYTAFYQPANPVERDLVEE